jgi:hypothetical protein
VSRRRGRIFGAVLGTMIVLGGFTVVTAGGGGSANLWVDVNGGTCTRSGSLVGYVDAAACTPTAAYTACSAGDTIRVKPGSYATGQSFSGTKAAPGCTMIGEDKTTTTWGPVSMPTYLEVQNVTIDAGTLHATGIGVGGNNDTLTNVDLNGQFASVYVGADAFTWNGGNFLSAPQGQRDYCGTDSEPMTIADGADDTLIEYVHFGNANFVTNAACNHQETVRIDGTSLSDDTANTTLNGNFFESDNLDDTSRVFITKNQAGGYADPNGVVLVNNYFGTAAQPHLNVRNGIASCATYKVAYNTFEGWDSTIQCATTTGMLWVGNLGGKAGGGCPGTFTKNEWTGSVNRACGTDTWVTGGVDFASFPSTGNQSSILGFGHNTGLLTAGSPAINAGENTQCTALAGNVDRDNRARSGVCDAGADEFGN